MEKEIIPTPEEFFIKLGLYEKVTVNEETESEILAIINFKDTIDTYCPECNEHSIFSRKGNISYCYSIDNLVNGHYYREYKCSRNHNHTLFFILSKSDTGLEKIGQEPSLADLHTYDIKKYSKVLKNKYFVEFSKAIGLYSHGIGVGSFVYLRRIFEYLIYEEYQKNKILDGWNEETYRKADMSEKINILKEDLPDFLVRNKKLYSILSKGIHELEEKECNEYFPIIKVGIECILDEKLVILQRKQKEEETKKAIDAIHQKIK